MSLRNLLPDFRSNYPLSRLFPMLMPMHTVQPQSISELLVKQIYSPVRWTDVIQGIRENGVDNFVECGPGTVLTKLLRQIP